MSRRLVDNDFKIKACQLLPKNKTRNQVDNFYSLLHTSCSSNQLYSCSVRHYSLGLSDLLTQPKVLMRNNSLLSRLYYYFSFVTMRSDCDFADVGKRVVNSQVVKDAIVQAATEDAERILGRNRSNSPSKDEDDGDSSSRDFALGHDEEEDEELKRIKSSLERKHRHRAVDILNHMKTCISSSLLRIAGWILFKLLSRILSSIQYSRKQLENLRNIRRGTKYPIVYLPVHRSHLDYILISFILYMNDIKPPLVAAGDNLYIPFFGNLMKGLGAFFIKRKLDPKQGQKDHVYRAVLETYMTENLRSGESIEFFLEGGRSRSGKGIMPKAGLLSVVVNTVLQNQVEDVVIVPVGVSYDKLIDGSFVSEQLGKQKTKESFTLAVKAIWSTLRSNFGSVRVDFATPFSLKDYLRCMNKYHQQSLVPLKASSGDNKNNWDSVNFTRCLLHSHDKSMDSYSSMMLTKNNIASKSCPVGLRSFSSSASLYGLDIILEDENKRAVIQELAEHVVYDACNSSAVMSTQMLAFILLTSYRKGATLRQLVPAMNWLRQELIRKRREIGWSGETPDAIKYACSMLGRDLVTTEVIQMAWGSSRESLITHLDSNRIKKIVLVKPAVKVPSVLELQYYSSSIAASFAMESIVVNSLYSLFEWGLESIDDIETNNNLISRKNLVNCSLELCHILKYEFILSPPCTNVEHEVNRAIDDFIAKDILRTKQSNSYHKSKYRHFDLDFIEEDDGLDEAAVESRDSGEDDWLSVSINQETVDLLRFYRNVVSPLIESYWLSAKHLYRLLSKPIMDFDAFTSSLTDSAKDQLRQGLLCFQESIAAEPLKNSVTFFENSNILERKSVSGVTIIYLRDDFQQESALKSVIKNIERFKK